MNSWDKAMEKIKENLSIPTLETWFRPVECANETEERVVLKVPSELVKEWLETKYISLIKSAIEEVKKHPVEVDFIVEERKTPQVPKIKVGDITLNKNYTFENFVVGSGNRLMTYTALSMVTIEFIIKIF